MQRPYVVLPPGIYGTALLGLLFPGQRIYIGQGPKISRSRKQRQRIRRLMRTR